MMTSSDTPPKLDSESFGSETELSDSHEIQSLSKFLETRPHPQILCPVDIFARFPSWPTDWEKGKYYYFLGWPRNETIWKRLETHYRSSHRRAEARGEYRLNALFDPPPPDNVRNVLELCARARYKQILPAQGVSADSPEPESAERIPILSIYHTKDDRMLWHPRHMVYLWICAVMGSRPTWFKDPTPKTHWDSVEIDLYFPADPSLEQYLEDKWDRVSDIGDEEDEAGDPGPLGRHGGVLELIFGKSASRGKGN